MIDNVVKYRLNQCAFIKISTLYFKLKGRFQSHQTVNEPEIRGWPIFYTSNKKTESKDEAFLNYASICNRGCVLFGKLLSI